MTDPSFDARAAKLYLSGLSTYLVAESLGCSQGKVARSLRRSGTPMRDHRFVSGRKRAA